MTLEELQVVITASTAPLQTKLKQIEKDLKGLNTATNKSMNGLQKNVDKATIGIGKSFNKLKVVLAALGIGKVLKDGFNLARTYEASVQQVNRMFGMYSGALDNWVQKNAKTFGMARADAMKYASIYGNLVRAFEKDGAKMTQYTTDLMKATTIIASNTGRTVADVSERIRSGILGNTEAIEDLGIYAQVAMLKTTNAFKQIANGRTWDKLTFQEQQQIRVLSILEQTSSQFGDSIQHNMNYQLMQLTATLKNIALNIGQAFMPILNVVVPILNTMANALEMVTSKLAAFMNALFGTNFNSGPGANTSQDFTSMGEEASKAGDEAEEAGKKAQKALMGFDEVNNLNQSNGESNENSGNIMDTITKPDVSPLEQAAATFADRLKVEIDKIKGLLKDGFEIGIGGDYKERLEELLALIPRIKSALQDIFDDDIKQSFRNMVESLALSAGQTAGSWGSVGITIATNLLGGVTKYLEQNGQFIKDRLIGIFDTSSEIATIWGEWVTTFADIFSVFGGETGQQITANIIGMFSNGFLGATELSLKFGRDLLDTITGPIIENKDKFKVAIENTLKPIETITGDIKNLVTNTFKSILDSYNKYIQPTFNNIKEGFSKIVSSLLDAYNTHIAPTIDKLAKKWSEFYSDTLQPVIDKAIDVLGKLVLAVSELWNNCLAPFVSWVIEIMGPGVSACFEAIGSIFLIIVTAIVEQTGNLLDAFSGLIDFISGVFSGDWEKAWNGIKAIFDAITSSFETIIKEPLQKGLDWVKNTFKTSWDLVCNGLSNSWENMWTSIKNGTRNAINWIIDKMNNFINGINSKLRFTLPEIMGGATIGFEIPNIPRLARGGIVDGATFMGNYIAGEAGKEMIVPLENTSFVDKLASALGNAVLVSMQVWNRASNSNTGGPTEVVLELNDRAFARVIIPALQKEIKRTGVKLG